MTKIFFTSNNISIWKKNITIVLLLIGGILTLCNQDIFEHKNFFHTHQETDAPTIVQIPLRNGHILEQEFVGQKGNLTMLKLNFDIRKNPKTTGTITMNILDCSRNLLQSTKKEIEHIPFNGNTRFHFKNPQTLSDNTTYILQLVIENTTEKQYLYITSYEEKDTILKQLYINAEPLESQLRIAFHYEYYDIASLIHMLVLLLFTFLVVCVLHQPTETFRKNTEFLSLDTNKLISRILFILTPTLCFLLADRMNGFSFTDTISRFMSWVFVFNLFIYITIWLILYVIVNRIQYTSFLTILVVFVINLINYYVWEFRGCPILATDIKSLQTALNVAGDFTYFIDLNILWGILYVICFSTFILRLNSYKSLNIQRRAFAMVVCICVICGFNVLFFHSNIVKNKDITAEVWRPQVGYAKNGTALSFVLSWTYTKVETPSKYSIENVSNITSAYVSDSVSEYSENTEIMPNIITIMNESLSDLTYNGDIVFSEDYLPFLHSLEEDTVKGRLYVSIQGANTANSEFEFLTGYSMSFLPFRCIPYNVYIDEKMPSMAQNMQMQGYSGINAYHPYYYSGWNRGNVYPLLGFNQFYSDTYYHVTGNDTLLRNYISDEADFQQIIEDYEAAKAQSDAPFYLFNVTMQNHGGYDGRRGLVDVDITIQNAKLKHTEAEQYINLAKKSDDAFKQLLTYFEDIDEPTIIVMFGDHQPPIHTDFYSAQFGTDVNHLSIQQQANWFSVPYVIWANYDIEEQYLDMSANYLSSYVMKLANLKLTGYNKYLLDLQKKLPIISAACYMDAQGRIYAHDEKSSYSELLKEYQMIQYNGLFDIDNRLDSFFFLRE